MDFRVVNIFIIAACRFVLPGSGGDDDDCLGKDGSEGLEGIGGDNGIVFEFEFEFEFEIVRDEWAGDNGIVFAFEFEIVQDEWVGDSGIVFEFAFELELVRDEWVGDNGIAFEFEFEFEIVEFDVMFPPLPLTSIAVRDTGIVRRSLKSCCSLAR